MPEVKFEKISPADFFYRNRDIAGFSSPARSLYMSIRELVENSFPYDEPILIREDGRIRVVKIGELVEGELSQGGYIEFNRRYYKPLRKNIEVLTIDENLKLAFKRITAVYKHPSPKTLFKVKLQAGREVRTTSAHNIFILNDELEVICKETRSLKPGDKVIVPVSGYEPENPMKELDVLDELLRLPEEETENIMLYGALKFYDKVPPQTHVLLTSINGSEITWSELYRKTEEPDLKKPNNTIQTLRREEFLVDIGKGVYRVDREENPRNRHPVHKDWAKLDSIPFNYFRRNMPKNIDKHQIRIGVKRSKVTIPAVIPITPELMRILGYYVSKGSIIDGVKITFSFGHHELATCMKDLAYCLEKVFGIKPLITKPHESGINVIVNSASIAFLFEKVLKMGTNSNNKRVPYIVFNVPKMLKWHFLMAYIKGDGYVQDAKRNRRIVMATSSKELFTDLKFLLTLMGLSFSTHISGSQERVIKGGKTRCSRSYYIYIREGVASESQSLPIGSYRRELLRASGYRYTNLYRPTVQKRRLARVFSPEQLPEKLRKIVFSDIGFLPVKEIEIVQSDSEWVYDISVEDVERFIGGEAIALLHNSLDAAEVGRIPPNIIVELSCEGNSDEGVDIYRLRVEDNGIGVAPEHIPRAFATVFYGSKYGYKQSRGTFGLGGTMALLYGQITTNRPATVISSTGGKEIHKFVLMIDIVKNEPRVFEHEVIRNEKKWHGTIVEFYLEADYSTSKAKIIQYFAHTAMANPYATIMFIDPRGRLYYYPRVTTEVPEPPKEALPHPVGVDVETMSRLLAASRDRTMLSFLMNNFQRVGEKTAREVLQLAGIPEDKSPRKLSHDEVTKLVEAIKRYGKFRAPDPSSLSPIGKKLLEVGIRNMLDPEFLYVVQRPPSSYSGYPFVVEVGLAYGGGVPVSDTVQLYRFANKIPLLYDERADVSWKVVSERIDWSTYKVRFPAPVAVVTHICSPKVPYKTVGKEAIADRPEIERELVTALREAARELRLYLSRVEKREITRKKLDIYARYLPLIAKYSAELADRGKPPKIDKLLRSLGIDEKMVEEAKKKAMERLQELYATE
jgi:DNA topoisomerase-6 subunit B